MTIDNNFNKRQMKLIICDNYEKMSEEAALIVISQMKKKPGLVLGLAAGATPIGLYKLLVEANRRAEIDFSQVTTFNVDEYYRIAKSDPGSYWQTMRRIFLNKVNILEENINILNYSGNEAAEFCNDYEKKIKARGGIDLQILGIGRNGHIGFNEPGSDFRSKTRKVKLAEKTIQANAKHFRAKDEMPDEALTMGLATILKAKKILLLASGKDKAEAVAEAIEGPMTEAMPASVLQKHRNAAFVIDKEAGERLRVKKVGQS